MPTHRIFVSDGLAPEGLALLQTAGDVTADNKITAADLAAVLPEYDALVVRSRTKVTAALLAAGTKLKVIGRAGVGVDNIDVKAATERGTSRTNPSTMEAERFMRDRSRVASAPGLPLSHQAQLRRIGKSIRAGECELQANPRSRSAIMRVAEKLSPGSGVGHG